MKNVQGRTVAIVVAVLLLVGGVSLILFNVLKGVSAEPSSTPTGSIGPVTTAVPEPFRAGSSFKVGHQANVDGVETVAELNGLNQQVRGTNPTEKWKTLFPGAVCEENQCVAPAAGAGAPAATGSPAESDSKEGGSFSLSDKFGPLMDGGLLASLATIGLLYFLITQVFFPDSSGSKK